jgi:hypothetical protein
MSHEPVTDDQIEVALKLAQRAWEEWSHTVNGMLGMLSLNTREQRDSTLREAITAQANYTMLVLTKTTQDHLMADGT